MPSENNKRIAKNTMFLYFRMLFTMGVSLYTSRVVLNTLGIDDYGIYNIVGGVIVMFGFLNSSMSGATSRFLTFELGTGDYEKLKKTFSTALTIHFIIAGIIFVLGETIGLWWLENKLVIPPERMFAAQWVYQLSILSAMISITQVPYNATIIARERMNVYACVEILNSILKLGIVYLLVIGNFDKLILYAILILCITIIITTIYKIYCTKNFPESHYKFVWEKDILNPMFSYSGWNFYLSSSYTLKTQGINMLLNMFFGVAVNTAYGIAMQVQNAAANFSNNFLTAVRPQIVKYYATGDIYKMQNLIINASKFSFLLLFLISFPLIVENNFVLNIWLKKVPDYAVVFSQLFLIYFIISSSMSTITTAIQATGKVKALSIINGSLFLIVLPISYFLLSVGYPAILPMIINIVLLILNVIINIIILKYNVPTFSLKKFVLNFIINSVIITVITSVLPLWIHFSLKEGLTRFLLVSSSFVLILCTTSYFIALNDSMKKTIKILVINKLKILKR